MTDLSGKSVAGRKKTLAANAYTIIRDRIAGGQFKRGQHLALKPLAKELKMSMGPVSEALRELSRIGLVEFEPRAGARVREFGAEDLRSSHILRTALECEAVRQCTLRASEAQIRALMKLAHDLDAAIDNAADFRDVTDPDSHFHGMVASYGMVTSLVASLQQHQEMYRVIAMNEMTDCIVRAFGRHSHRLIVEAVRSRDMDEAEAIMRKHCLGTMRAQLGMFGVRDVYAEEILAERSIGTHKLEV